MGDNAFESAWVDAIADQHKDYMNEMRPALMVYMGFAQGGQYSPVFDFIFPVVNFLGILSSPNPYNHQISLDVTKQEFQTRKMIVHELFNSYR